MYYIGLEGALPSFTVREIQCKSAINRVQGLPFSWSINPYRGCRHACVYCYARPTHEYLGLSGGEEFQEVILAKVNAPDIVRVELNKKSWRGETVVIGTATDPYQQAESRYKLTRRILEAFRDRANPVSVTTKSPMILRDIDVLADLARMATVTVCVTITTMDEGLWRKIEPTTAKPRKRLEAIRVLRSHGIQAGVLLSPILPGLTDGIDHLEPVVAQAAEYGGSFLTESVLRLGPGISDYYLPFIEQHFPKLARPYARLYRTNYTPAYYSEAISSRVEDLRLKHGLSGKRFPANEAATAAGPQTRQLELFAQVA